MVIHLKDPVTPQWSLAGKLWLGAFVVLCLITAHVVVQPYFWREDADDQRVYVGAIFAWGGTGSLWLIWFLGRRRKAALTRVCRVMSWNHAEEASNCRLPVLSHFRLFRLGEWHIVEHVVDGKYRGQDFMILDYQFGLGYDTPGGYARGFFVDLVLQIPYLSFILPFAMGLVFPAWRGHWKPKVCARYSQTLIILPKAAPDLPDFQLTAKFGFWTRPFFSRETDIDMPPDLQVAGQTHPEFSKHYCVSGVDLATVRGIFTPTRLNALVLLRGWNVEVANGNVLIYRLNQQVKPLRYPDYLDKASWVVKALNTHQETCAKDG